MQDIHQMTETQADRLKSQIELSWKGIVSNPEQLTDLSEQKVAFAAGGGLVTRFGDENSPIWQGIQNATKDGNITIAGIEFSIDDLSLMGDYYRFLKEKGYNFHCIDERLEGDQHHLETEVHEGCGACAAVGASTGMEGVEDALLDELEQEVKQAIYGDLPHHESMAILADLRGSDVVLGDKRQELKDNKALPFNASISLDEVKAFTLDDKAKAESLIKTLAKWNVQIARNIIGGDHNSLNQLAEQTIIVVDKRGADQNDLVESAISAIANVQHGQLLYIAA